MAETQRFSYDEGRGNDKIRVTGEETILSAASATIVNPGALTNILHAMACPMSGVSAYVSTIQISHSATTLRLVSGNSAYSNVYKWEAEGYIT